MTDVAAAVQEHVAAFNTHDTERILAGLTTDVEWNTGVDAMLGIEALRDVFDPGLWALAPSLEVRSLIVGDDCAATELVERLTVDGAQREFWIAAFFTFRDGLIQRVKVYREGSADLE
jgi:hypothetical protein